MGMYLKNLAADIVLLSRGQDCLDLVAQQPPALILMDCQLPDLDGFETVRRLRGSGYTGAVLALTASTDQETLERCCEAGMNGHIPKPVDAAGLRARIQSALGSTLELSGSDSAIPDPLARVRWMASSPQDDPLVRHLIESFIRAGEESLQQLQDAHRGHNQQVALALAHQLRGAAATFGASQFAQVVALWEDQLVPANLEQSSPSLAALLESWSSLRHDLANFLAKNDGPPPPANPAD